ncbi:MAG: hypothetical protein ACK40O_01820 [Allosphingosinicella sp.]
MFDTDTAGHVYPGMKQVLNSPAFLVLLLSGTLLNLLALSFMLSPCALAQMAPAFGVAQIEGSYFL